MNRMTKLLCYQRAYSFLRNGRGNNGGQFLRNGTLEYFTRIINM